MAKNSTPIGYLVGFGLAGLLLGPWVGWQAAFLWADYYTKKTGFSAGNAPPFFLLVGLILGPLLGVFLGRFIYRHSQTPSE